MPRREEDSDESFAADLPDLASSGTPRQPRRAGAKRPRFVPKNQILAGLYRLEAAIGSGGMGTVYGAIDLQTGAPLAIKFLNPDIVTPLNLRRFRREAQTGIAVKHRRVCAVHYLGVERGIPYIVMERLVGETLRQRMVQIGPLTAIDAVTVMIQVLDALAAAHSVGVIHRDIKPGNIFITSPRGSPPQVKVIDFGLAKAIGPLVLRVPPRSDESTITTTGITPGTPFYMSPEQVAGIRDLDHRVDVWAAGLTLYEMLLGRRAYAALSYADLVRSIMLVSLPPISTLRNELPPGFDAVLEKALAKRREDRYASAQELRAALIDVWARHRTDAVARGEKLRAARLEPEPFSDLDEVELTELDVSVDYEP